MIQLNNERGLALYLALVMLVSIAIIGVASSRSALTSVANIRVSQAEYLVENAATSLMLGVQDVILNSALGDASLLTKAFEADGLIICFDSNNDPVPVSKVDDCEAFGWNSTNTISSISVPNLVSTSKYSGGCFNRELNGNDGTLNVSDVLIKSLVSSEFNGVSVQQEQDWMLPFPTPVNAQCAY